MVGGERARRLVDGVALGQRKAANLLAFRAHKKVSRGAIWVRGLNVDLAAVRHYLGGREWLGVIVTDTHQYQAFPIVSMSGCLFFISPMSLPISACIILPQSTVSSDPRGPLARALSYALCLFFASGIRPA